MNCPKCRRSEGWVTSVSASAAGESYECGWCHHEWIVLPKVIRDMIAGYERALTVALGNANATGPVWKETRGFIKAARTLRSKAEHKESPQ